MALVFYFINLVLQFFSRKIFLDYLGVEVLGLNTTAQNLLGFLNLAELGIGAAVSYNLYKPLFDGDRQAINDIVSIQGWLYRRIALIVIAGACVLMCFFPLIFAKADVPLWYTYGTFLALLASALLSYFTNYRQIVLAADQKTYLITYCFKGGMAVKTLLQLVAIGTLEHGYVYWIAIEFVMAFITSFVLNHTIQKVYPWLHPDISNGKRLQKRYPDILQKTKQVFFHRIGAFVLTQTSPLIIYAYASLTLVAIYGNYMLIVLGVMSLAGALLNNVSAGIGNLVAEGDKKRITSVYWEITSSRIWMASTICFVFYMSGHGFIRLWVGEAYIMQQSSFIVLMIITFITLTRTNEAFLAAYGLYQDVWAPVTEATLNLGLSVLLGYYWGLTGILSGVLISLILMVCMWKPFFLFRYGFKEKINGYICRYLKYLIVSFLPFVILRYVGEKFFPFNIGTYKQWIIYAVLLTLSYALCCLILLCGTDKFARLFVKRFYKQLL